jgi:hypothetical protein
MQRFNAADHGDEGVFEVRPSSGSARRVSETHGHAFAPQMARKEREAAAPPDADDIGS